VQLVASNLRRVEQVRSVAKPSVSVVTVVKNGAATIADCVESVLGQNYPVEYIVMTVGPRTALSIS